MTTDSTIECTSFYGHKVNLPKSRLILRPSAYAVLRWENKVLLVTNHRSGRFYLPGGGIEPGERIAEGLRREVKEETGLEIEQELFIYFAEDFFYYDPHDEAYHALLFYYTGRTKTTALAHSGSEAGDEGQPQWVPQQNLTADAFHNHGELLMKVLQAKPEA